MVDLYKEIRTRYGAVKRTRGFYVYTEKNVRLLDMCLDGGAAVTGRKNNNVSLTIKHFTDKGLYSFLPTSADYTLQKALHILFPEHPEVRFYSDYTEALQYIEVQTKEKTYLKNIWRPLLPASENIKNRTCFFVQPPYCTELKIAVYKKMAGVKIPEGCRVNALEKAALARAFFDIIKFIELSKKEKNTNAVAQYGQAKDLCAHFWNIENIYLFPKIKKTEYEYFFKGALDARIVISPYFDIPSIFPNIKVYSELINFLQTKIN